MDPPRRRQLRALVLVACASAGALAFGLRVVGQTGVRRAIRSFNPKLRTMLALAR